MIYETCVILNNVYYYTDEIHLVPNIYKKHYYNHPQCKWARVNLSNFKSLLTYLYHLLIAYKEHGGFAWNKEKLFYRAFQQNLPNLKEGSLTTPYLTFGNKSNPELDKKYKAVQSQFGKWNSTLQVWETSSWDIAVEAYRTYYKMKIFKQGKLPIWTHNHQPSWYVHTDLSLI